MFAQPNFQLSTTLIILKLQHPCDYPVTISLSSLHDKEIDGSAPTLVEYLLFPIFTWNYHHFKNTTLPCAFSCRFESIFFGWCKLKHISWVSMGLYITRQLFTNSIKSLSNNGALLIYNPQEKTDGYRSPSPLLLLKSCVLPSHLQVEDAKPFIYYLECILLFHLKCPICSSAETVCWCQTYPYHRNKD